MTHRFLALTLILPIMTGCMPPPDGVDQGAPAPLAPGVHTGTLEIPGGPLPYRLFMPEMEAGESPQLLMLLHGCTQDAEDIARGTRMDSAAAALGVAVLYPEQSPDAHANRCWNWYLPEHQRRAAGEPHRLVSLAEHAAGRIGAAPGHFYVAGISAGGAAALTLAATYPDRVTAAAVHSALPYGIAQDQPEALALMADGPDLSATAMAARVLDAMAEHARPVPLMVLHGRDDPAVHRANGAATLDQWAEVHAALTEGASVLTTRTEMHGGRSVEITSASHGEGTRLDLWMIEGLGHAWSGGSPEGTYTDPEGPDATEVILRFLLAHPSR